MRHPLLRSRQGRSGHLHRLRVAWHPEPVLKSKQPLPFEAAKVEVEVEKEDADLAADDLEIDVDEEAEENPDDEVDLGGDDDIGVPGAAATTKRSNASRGAKAAVDRGASPAWQSACLNAAPRRPAPRARREKVRGRSSAGRALQWHCRGQGFDPPRLHQPPPFGLRLASQPGARRTEAVRRSSEGAYAGSETMSG